MSFEVNIKVNGKVIPSYKHEGDTWVEGRVDSEYTLEFKNKTSNKLLVIPSVDGLSILDGLPATEESKGYIVSGFGTIEIPGWTLDNNNVAKFVFSSVDNSYSTYQSGSTDNNGVIGFKVFYEKPKPITNKITDLLKRDGGSWYNNPPSYDSWNGWDNSSDYYRDMIPVTIMQCASAMGSTTQASLANTNVDHSVGTGFGDQTEYKTTTESFDRGTLADTIILYYDSLKNLKARGIKIEPEKKKPQAFKTIGCVPPKDWNNSK